MVSNLTALMKQLGYVFKNESLLGQALTHRSVPKANNERFEYLGDAILNYVIAEALFHQYPETREGKLTRQRASLVNGDTLAQIGREFNLGHYLRLGISEQKSGGHHRDSIIADALEAIIAAIYLDGGMDICKGCVIRWYATRLANAAEHAAGKDAKTQLQEYLQAQKLALPSYEVIETLGKAHDQTFVVVCRVPDAPHDTQARAKSRRKAEQLAAIEMLKLFTDLGGDNT